MRVTGEDTLTVFKMFYKIPYLYIHTDPSCSRVTNPDMSLNSGSGLDITMGSGYTTL